MCFSYNTQFNWCFFLYETGTVRFLFVSYKYTALLFRFFVYMYVCV